MNEKRIWNEYMMKGMNGKGTRKVGAGMEGIG